MIGGNYIEVRITIVIILSMEINSFLTKIFMITG